MNEAIDPDHNLYREVHELASLCLEGTATDDDWTHLEQLILRNADSRSAYIRYIQDSVTLHQLAQARGAARIRTLWESASAPVPQSPGSIPSSPEAPGSLPRQAGSLRSEAPTPQAVSPLSPPREVRKSKRHGTGKLIAAGVIALAATVFVGELWRPFRTMHRPPLERVAKLQHAADVRWSRDGQELATVPGTWMMNGRYRIEQGIAQVSFPWGTEVTFEGPAEFELQPNELRKLYQGQLVAKVPPSDHGFTIDAPSVKVVDLGTEFGMRVDPSGEAEVHVFKGEVETRTNSSGPGTPINSVRLLAGSARNFLLNGATAEGVDVVYNPNRFQRAWQVANRISTTTGAVRFVHPPPVSVMEGATESNEGIFFFLERERVTIPRLTMATIANVGFYTTFVDRAAPLSPGLIVDSYLVHFDPVGSEQSQPLVAAEGSITFERPIVAVIARGDQLAASDRHFSSPGTQYMPSNTHVGSGIAYSVRGLVGNWLQYAPRIEPASNDRLRISPDRKTLSVSFEAGGESDQIRVLVAADDFPEPLSLANDATASPQPFLGRPFHIEEIIEAEDFDEGGEGVAYYDSTPNCLAMHYRLDSSVELLPYGQVEEGDFCVANVRAGDWIVYTIQIEKPGAYVLMADVGSAYGGGWFHVEFGEMAKTREMIIPNTGGATSFTTISSEPIELPAGRTMMRLVMDRENSRGWIGCMDSLRIVPVDSPLLEQVGSGPMKKTRVPLDQPFPRGG